MKKVIAVVFGVVMLTVVLMGSSVFAQQDATGCKDHPFLTRMEGFYIKGCQKKDFDQHEFYDPATKQQVKVEGRKYYADYDRKKDARDTSKIQISRNYENAIKAIGGQAYETSYNTYLKFIKDGKETWVDVRINLGGGWYNITIIEKEAMKQEVTADAKFMADGISSTGHVAIYGIYFEFNKSDVKPESDPALQEINKLLSSNTNLKVFIVGHTDNVGGVDYNMKLSQARADAVVKVLTTKHKVNPQRLKAYGVEQLAPVAPNKTEDGRAKNRRVELVEQ
jgi:outer membrane protein OmpA-like peptidoglycan-associated protein